MAEAKRLKTYLFHPEWEEDYFLCTRIQGPSVSSAKQIPKKGNLQQRFKMVHKSYQRDFPAKIELCSQKVQELRSQLAAQQSIFTRPNTKGKAATIASYRVSHVLAKHKKSFKDSEVVKEAFIETADALFGEFKNKTEIVAAIKDMQLLRNTVTRRCERMAEDVQTQLKKDITACE